MSPPVLAAVGVQKSYWLGRREIAVLKGIDLAIGRGELVALLGASGAGKSTLLHVLGLLDPPTAGAVHYDGEPVHALPVAARARLRNQHVGFVFQFYHLIPELTALQNVMLSRMMQCSAWQFFGRRKAVRAAATAMLDEVGLGDRLHHRPAELSGGERQRVAIARALLAAPRVVLADEPTGNLDSTTADGVMDLIFRIHRERELAFLLVTHNAEIASRCHRIVHLKDGVVIA